MCSAISSAARSREKSDLTSDDGVTVHICSRCGAEIQPGAAAGGLCAACLLTTALADDPNLDEPSTILPPGFEVGAFRIVGLLGRGGMAAVYQAYDRGLERTVALKVLPQEFLHDRSFARRFEHEARVIASLEHPNIVPIHATGIDDGIPWMSMRLMSGGNMGSLLEAGRPEPGEAVRMLRHVADALDYAHAHGVVHRDVKPANILLDGDASVCIGDFGLARILESDQRNTRTGTVLGTPSYMAPEQALGDPIDHRCDIYSLGIVAYEVFVGAVPFTADSPIAVLMKHVNDPLPVPPDGVVPRPVMEAIRTAVAKDPAERWPSAGAFVTAVERALAAPRAHVSVPGPTASRHTRTAAIATLCAAVALTVWIARSSELLLPATPIMESSSAGIRDIEPAPSRVEGLATIPPPAPGPIGSTGRNDRQSVAPSPRPGAEQVTAGTTQQGASFVNTAPSPSPSVNEEQLVQPPAVQPVTAPVRPAAATNTPDAAPPEPAPRDAVTQAVRVRTVEPEYPAPARAAQLEGDVLIQAVVGADGRIRDATVLRSVHPLLDEAARKAVMQYVYRPAQRNGVPEAATVRLSVSFRLR